MNIQYNKILTVFILIIVFIIIGYLTFVIGPYNYKKNIATVGNATIGLPKQFDNIYYYCDGNVRVNKDTVNLGFGATSCASSTATTTSVTGCRNASACNYSNRATISGICTYATFAQVAKPGVTPSWIVQYRVQKPDGTITTSGSSSYTPPPMPTPGASACNTSMGNKTYGQWLNAIVPVGQ